MGEDFGVRLGTKLVSLLNQPLLDAVKVLNHAVMHDRDPPALVEVRMGVLVRRRAMRGPAGVADAEWTGGGLRLEHPAEAFVDFPFLLARLEFGTVQHAHPGAVVTAVFEPAQSLEQDGGRLLFADVAYNAAHKSSGTRLARTRPP